MNHLAYSFCIMLFHSLWQGGLLLLFYVLMTKLFLNRSAAIEKRNFLFSMIGAQLVLSILTFVIYFAKPEQTTANAIKNLVDQYLPATNLQPICLVLFAGYLFALSYKITQTVLHWKRFNRIYKTGLEKPSLDLKLFTQITANRFSIKRPVQLFLSKNIHTPLTFGFFKPVILLPIALINQIDLQQAETLIVHELTHIKANDYLYNLLVIFTENVFFFNPFIISLCKKIKLERELHCDSTVIHFKYSPVLYAQTLLQAEKLKQTTASLQLAAVSSKHQLLQRIQFFSSSKVDGRKDNGWITSLLVLFIVVLFSGYAILRIPSSNNNVITETAAANLPGITPNTIEASPTFVSNKIIENLPRAEKIENTQLIVDNKKMIKQDAIVEENTVPSTNDEALIPAAFSDKMFNKQVILQEETSGSKTATLKVYNLVMENGQWVLKPDWMATSQIMSLDSLIKTGDSSGVKLLLNQQ